MIEAPESVITKIDRNLLGLVTSVTQGKGSRQSSGVVSWVNSTTQPKLTRHYTYDANYQLDTLRHPELGVVDYDYNARGLLQNKIEGGQRTSYYYDNRNRLLSSVYHDNTFSNFYYDVNDRLYKSVRKSATEITNLYRHDANGNLTSETVFQSDGSSEPRVAVTLGIFIGRLYSCLLYTSPSPRDRTRSRMPSSA